MPRKAPVYIGHLEFDGELPDVGGATPDLLAALAKGLFSERQGPPGIPAE